MIVSDNTLSQVQSLYDSGLYLDAYRCGCSAGPLRDWEGVQASILGARLASRLGGNRLSSLLTAKAWRIAPRNALTVLYRAYDLAGTKGPLKVWEFTESWEHLEGLSNTNAADLLSLRARIAGGFRDFELAWRLMDQALALDANSSWIWTERAGLLLTEERYQEAEQVCQRSLEISPWYRPAVQTRASLLQLQSRAEDASHWLEEACSRVQSCEVVGQLIGIQRDLGISDGMPALLDSYETNAPLLEDSGRKWLAANRCEVHSLAGEWGLAAEQAELVGDDYHLALATRLRNEHPVSRRVRIPLTRVIQKFNTCGPATLAMLAGFWGREGAHEAIADAICYDGTYDHSERQWCLDNGLVAREFRLTWESGCALLDAGLPFAVGTVEVNSAHLQAFMGYDAALKTFLVQDPSTCYFREAIAEAFLSEYSLYGPRAMVVLPQQESYRLDGIDLPEAELFDSVFAFNRALFQHDREQAEGTCRLVEEKAPGHRLYWQMRLGLAWYDNDSDSEVMALEALGAMYPDDPRILVRRIRSMKENGHNEALVSFLRKAVEKPRSHPALWRGLAVELSGDARRDDEAWKWLSRAHAGMPTDSGITEAWGDRWWRKQKRELAVDAYGFAASMSPTDERLARLWFDAERAIGHRDEAIARLQDRHAMLGVKSAQPARTLLWALDDLNHDSEADQVLREALQQHPDDGPLLLDAVWFFTRRGDIDSASTYLKKAEGRNPRGQWLRACANLQERLGEIQKALNAWEELGTLEPMAVDVHTAIARIISIVKGTSETRDYLGQIVERFPHHFGLQRLRLEWLRDYSLPAAEEAIRHLLELHPANGWAHRELALILGEQGQFSEAHTVAQHALMLEPQAPESHGVMAGALRSLGLIEEARRECQMATELNVDYTSALHALLGMATCGEQKLEDLAFIRNEMARQTLDGSALYAYRDLAFPLLDPQDLYGQLADILKFRPDLPAAWSVLVRHLMDMGRNCDASALAIEAALKFSRLPSVWIDASLAHRANLDRAKAIECAVTASEIAPNWADSWWTLASHLEDSGELEQAVAMLERVVLRLPNSPELQSKLAFILWRLGQRDAAFERILSVVTHFPGESTSWDAADQWSETLGKASLVLETARRITIERPGEARSWMILARVLPRSAMNEKLEALDKAVVLQPRLVDAYDLKAWLLASQGRYGEAEIACNPEAFENQIPFNLEGRGIWLLASQGKRLDALQKMEKLLLRHPDYFWGWQQCLEWAKELKDSKREGEARAAMARLAPNDVGVLCECADGATKAGEPEEATRYFKHAMVIAPGRSYPMHQWLRFCWGRRDSASITTTAQSALPGLTKAYAEIFLVLATAFDGRNKEAMKALSNAVCLQGPLEEAASDLQRGLESLGWRTRWRKALDSAARKEEIGMAFAPYWVEGQLQARKWGAWKHFEEWISRGHEQATGAISTYFNAIGQLKMVHHAKGFFVSNSVGWVRERTDLYGKVGYALANSEQWSKTAEWLAGAEHREDSEGWLCSNLVLALIELGRESEATSVARHVFSRGLKDHTSPNLASQIAYDAAVRGDLEESKQMLEISSSIKTCNLWRWKHVLANEVVSVLEGTPSKFAQKKAIRNLRNIARREFGAASPVMIKQHHQALRSISRYTGINLSVIDFYSCLFFRSWRSILTSCFKGPIVTIK